MFDTLEKVTGKINLTVEIENGKIKDVYLQDKKLTTDFLFDLAVKLILWMKNRKA